MAIAIVCGSGGFRTIFCQGVLSAFEQADFFADAYAGTSASAMVAAGAAVKKSNQIGVDFWTNMAQLKDQGNNMSHVMYAIIGEWNTLVTTALFEPGMPRVLVPASKVMTTEAAEITQDTQKARRLGRKLLISAARKDSSWADENLELRLFDTQADDPALRLTKENFDEVMYASTRMMHAWDVPATIDGEPYIDASYTCMIPAVELADLGYDHVIAISADPGDMYRSIFGKRTVPDHPPYHLIRPDIDPGELGADFTDASQDGLEAVYDLGLAAGNRFVTLWES